MLHRLPNEILLKILEKTKSKTVKECRLLNSQFDNLIQKFQLHLLKIHFLSITKFFNEQYTFFGYSTELREVIYLTYKTYQEMFTGLNIQLKKVRIVKKMSFTGISINEDFLRVFNIQRWLRKLDVLYMRDCIFDRNAETYCFKFLSKLRLNVLSIRNPKRSIEAATWFTFPKTILNYFRSELVYRGPCRGHVIEIPWMDDSLLENYIDGGKIIRVSKAFTSYTLGGVKEFLKKVSISNRTIKWSSGIMKNATAEEMDNLLKELKAEYRQIDWPQEQYISFSVTKLGEKHDISMQTFRNLTLD